MPQKSEKRAFRILISWTPASGGTEPIQYAAWLARTTDIEVRVLSAFVQPWHEVSLQKLGGKYNEWFEQEAKACKQAVKNTLQAAGIPREYWNKNYSVLMDGPSKPHLLTQAAEDFDADLVLLGSNQGAAKGRFLAGSTADSLLHYSPTPVGLSPRAAKLSKHGVTRLNFALTEEQGLDDVPALFDAASLASRWNVPLRIVVFSSNGLVTAPMNDNLDVALELTSQWREHSLGLLDVAREQVVAQFPELEITSEIGSGQGWRAAVDSMKWKKGDLMCLGSAPMGPIERVFIGSRATELLPHLSVPIIVWPSRKAS